MSEKRVLKRIGVVVVILGILQLPVLNAEAQTTIRVPSDYLTIQEAINAAVDGDAVLVARGTYVENINFLGKAITVASEEGPGVTIIDGDQAGPVVTLTSGEAQASVLRGFTLQNGNANPSPFVTLNGGGIEISSSPTIVDNIVSNNKGCFGGGGIAISFGSPLIQGNIITNNTQNNSCIGGGGGGISVSFGSPQILDNTISNNSHGSRGGGIFVFGGQASKIKGNVISGNTAQSEGGGISLLNSENALIVQNLITANSAGQGGGIHWSLQVTNALLSNTMANNTSRDGTTIFAESFHDPIQLINNIIVSSPGQTAIFCADVGFREQPFFRSNDIFSPSGTAYGGICTDQTGINGNISADPFFVDPANENYHLQPDSPAIDAGDNTAPELPDKDIDGDPRILDGDGDGVAVVDMGVDEFTPSISVIPFAVFDTRMLLFNSGSGKDLFFTKGSFTLGHESDGIDPSAEKVVFSLADTDRTFFDQTLPPGSFEPFGKEGFLFRAPKGSTGIRLMIIRPTQNEGQFTFKVHGKRLDLSGADNPPVTVSLQIGDDTGAETIPCRNLSKVLICQ